MKFRKPRGVSCKEDLIVGGSFRVSWVTTLTKDPTLRSHDNGSARPKQSVGIDDPSTCLHTIVEVWRGAAVGPAVFALLPRVQYPLHLWIKSGPEKNKVSLLHQEVILVGIVYSW